MTGYDDIPELPPEFERIANEFLYGDPDYDPDTNAEYGQMVYDTARLEEPFYRGPRLSDIHRRIRVLKQLNDYR